MVAERSGPDPDPASDLVVIGASHRTASAAIRDRLQVEAAALPAALAELRAAGVGEAVLLATCDRVEVVAAATCPERTAGQIVAFLAQRGGFAPAELAPHLYRHSGTAAVRHLFAVTASLDSLVAGEPQVLSQVKASHGAARAAGLTGGVVESALQAAYAAAKRVRTETTIAEQPVSMAAAAVRLVRDLHGEPGRCSALFIGFGEMSALIHSALSAAGLTRIAVTHPSQHRAETIARDWQCHAPPFAALAEALVTADIVVTAVGTRQPVLTAALLKQALRARRRRPMFVVDAAVPGDVEPAAEGIDGVFRYALADLEALADAGRAHRDRQAEAAWRIVGEGVDGWQRARCERAALPVLNALRDYVEATRRQALDDASGDAEKATRLLARRLLHGPSAALRDAAAAGPGDLDALSQALERAFGLAAGGAGETDHEDWP